MKDDVTPHLGRSITQSIRFLMDVREDVFHLFASMDKLLAEQGWQRELKSATSSDHPIRFSYRMFVPEQSEDKRELLIIGVLVDLLPPAPLDEAMMFGVAASFPHGTSPKSIWDSWWHIGSHNAMQLLRPSAEAVALPEETLRSDLMANAITAMAVLVPLCDVTDGTQLKDRFIDPIVRAATVLARR